MEMTFVRCEMKEIYLVNFLYYQHVERVAVQHVHVMLRAATNLRIRN